MCFFVVVASILFVLIVTLCSGVINFFTNRVLSSPVKVVVGSISVSLHLSGFVFHGLYGGGVRPFSNSYTAYMCYLVLRVLSVSVIFKVIYGCMLLLPCTRVVC